MGFAKKLFLSVCFGVGVGVACIAWRPIVGEISWTAAIKHGELVLVAVPLTASAVGYAAAASVRGKLDAVKCVVVGLGIVALVMSMGVYGAMSDPPPHQTVHIERNAVESYVILAVSVLLGSLSTYVTHRSE